MTDYQVIILKISALIFFVRTLGDISITHVTHFEEKGSKVLIFAR